MRSKRYMQKIKKLGAVKSAAHTSSGLYVKTPGGLRLRDLQVSKLAARLRKVLTFLTDADMPSIRAWCQLELLGDQAYAILRDKGITSNGVEPRRLLTDFRQLRSVQLVYANALGLTPAAPRADQGIAR
jgi:hypothetical protein